MAAATGSLISRLARALHVHPGEGRRVAWMMLYSAMIMGGMVVVGSTAASALFLSLLPDSATPYLFIGSGIASVLIFLGYSLAAARVPLRRLVLVADLLLLVVFLVLRLLLATPFGDSFALLLFLYLFVEASVALLIMQFWAIGAQIFNVREAQRLFGLMAAGGTLASMAAGLALDAGAGEAIGVHNLLVVVVAALGVCLVCVRVLTGEAVFATAGQQHGLANDEPVREAGAEAQEPGIASQTLLADLRTIVLSPLLRAIAGITILASLAVNTGAYQFFLALQSLFTGRSADLVAYLGAFSLWTGAAALFVQLFVSERLMRRAGVFGALLLLPLALGLGEGLGLLTGGALLAMTLVRATSPVLSETVNMSARTVLYLPVRADVRSRVQSILEIAYGLAFGLLGLLFLASQQVPGWSYVSWAVPALVIVVLWLALLRWTRPQYQRALVADLRSRRLDFTSLAIDVRDRNTVQALAAALNSPDELLVVHTLDLIGQAPAVDWTSFVTPLLEHRSADVRRLALRHLAATGGEEHVAAIEAHLMDPEPDVQAAAATALATCGGPAAAPRLAARLEEASPPVRGAIAVSLYRYYGPAWAETAAAALDALLAGPESAAFCAGARAVGALADPRLAHRLVPLLEGNPEVANAALEAAAALLHPSVRGAGSVDRDLLPGLLACLGRPATAPAAADALVACGPGVEPAVAALLDREPGSGSPGAGVWAPNILQRLGTPAAVAALGAHLDDTDETVRAAIYRAFASLAGRIDLGPLPTAALRECLLAEIRTCYTLYMQHASLWPKGGSAAFAVTVADGRDQGLQEATKRLLFQALEARKRRALDRVSCLIEALYAPAALGVVHQAFVSEQPGAQATAVELLATILPEPVRGLVMPVLEGPDERILDVAQRQLRLARHPARDTLDELAAGPDGWLRDAALVVLDRPLPGDGRAITRTFERVAWLQRSELFNGLDGEDLAPVAQRAREVCFAPGETFIREGERDNDMYVMVAGEVGIRLRGVGEVAVRGPGSVIGEMAVIGRRARSADCVALGDVLALQVGGDDFWGLMSERPRLAQGVIGVLAQRLDEATQRRFESKWRPDGPFRD